MTDQVYDVGDDVVSHQKQGNQHRLVLCVRPTPQQVGKWTPKDRVATVAGHWATFENGPNNGIRVA